MKILPFKIPKPNNDALVYQEDSGGIFYNKLHQHEEVQISYIVKGTGTLIVGDGINHYDEGDVIVIGSNLPHVFKSEKQKEKSIMLSLFFTKESFGQEFFGLAELNTSERFFNRSVNGFLATSHKQILQDYFFSLNENTKLDRFISLLKIIETLSRCQFRSLSTFVYEKQYSDIEGNRMRDVFEYTMTHFKKDISLNTIANIAIMTPNAFCKYFKKRTNKSYFTFLNELRVEHASKLLAANLDESIAEIAELSGFNNISNFNRKFKSIKGLTPSQFKKAR